MKTLNMLLLLATISFASIAQETPKLSAYEQYRLQKKRADTTKWIVKDSIMFEKKLPEGIIKYHYNYKTSSKGKRSLPTYTELIRNGNSEILWDTSFVCRPQGELGGILVNNNFTFLASNGDSYYQFMATVYDTVSKKWHLQGSHKIPQSFNGADVKCFFIGANTLYRFSSWFSKTPQIYRINNYGELEVYKLTNYYRRDLSIPLPAIDRHIRLPIDTVRNYYYKYLKKETNDASIDTNREDDHKTKVLSSFKKKQKANINSVQKDIVLLEKKLPEGTIRFHGSYDITRRKHKTPPTDTYIELVQGEQTIILWDTSMLKVIAPIDKTDFMLYDNVDSNGSDMAFTFKTMSNNNAQAQLVSTAYDRETNKYLLKGCHTYPVGTRTCQPIINQLIGTHTLLYYSPCDTLPKIYRLNNYGDLEVYLLNEIRPRDKSIPLPGLPNLVAIEQAREKKREPYYDLLEKNKPNASPATDY